MGTTKEADDRQEKVQQTQKEIDRLTSTLTINNMEQNYSIIRALTIKVKAMQGKSLGYE